MNGIPATQAKAQTREFHFTQNDFRFIQSLIKERAGINLSDSKDDLVYARLAKRLRTLSLTSFEAYCAYVVQQPDELVNLTNAITTNLTAFFREQHHFNYLRDVAVPEWVRLKQNKRQLRIWSAGCSSGEEPYSIAMTLLDALPDPGSWDLRILATDLDSTMVAHGAAGIYAQDRVEGIDKQTLSRWFLRGQGRHAGKVRVHPDLQEVIRFKQLNLMDAWPMAQPFDIIFCRNVVIYFDKPTQRTLFSRYADQLSTQGLLVIGHSETLNGVSERFAPMCKTLYRRTH